ncbi:MAG: DUF3943 domain-containing protein [Bdellovibrionia bacterium]
MIHKTRQITAALASATLALFLSSNPARAESASLAEAQVLVSTNSPLTEPNFSKDACKLIQDTVYNWNLGTLPSPRCIQISSPDSAEIQNARNAHEATLYISMIAKPDGSHSLTIENWGTRDSADFHQLSWTIEASADWKLQTQKLLSRFTEFDADKTKLQKFLLINGLTPYSRIGYSAKRFYDRSSGSQLSFDAAYSLFRDENPKQKHYLQAGLEIAALLGASTIHYYVAPKINFPDWEYDLESSIKARANFRAVRYDDNQFNTNVGHYYAGTVYYTLARSNGLDRMESLLYTFAASSAWEYIAEYREVVSINDQINTTLGGFIIGEALHEIGRLFASGSDTLQTRILRATFGSPDHFNSWLSQKTSGSKLNLSETGFKPDVWGKAGIYYSHDANVSPFSKTGDKASRIGFDAQVIDIPLFEEPGHVRSLLTDTVFASFLWEHGTNDETLEDFKLFAKTTLAAYYEKNLGRDAQGNLSGYNLFVGPSMALDIDDTNSSIGNSHSDKADFHGIAHIVGGTLDLTAYTKGYRIRAILDIYGDFAMMRSYAFDQYAKTHDVSNVPNVTRHHDYYYGTGYTTSLGLVVNKGRFEAGAKVEDIRTDVLNSRTRFAADTDHISQQDRRTKAQAWVAYQLNDSVQVKIGAEKNIRSGTVGDTNLSGSDIRKYSTLIYTFK